jgi:hypothetical protein
MKAKLTFDLPDDQDVFDAACKGIDWKMAMQDLDNTMRGVDKHSNSEEEAKHAQRWRDELHSILDVRGLTLF